MLQTSNFSSESTKLKTSLNKYAYFSYVYRVVLHESDFSRYISRGINILFSTQYDYFHALCSDVSCGVCHADLHSAITEVTWIIMHISHITSIHIFPIRYVHGINHQLL